MKRVCASTDIPYKYEQFITPAKSAGYETSIDSQGNLEFSAVEDADNMPILQVDTYTEGGEERLNLTLTFPVLSSKDSQYIDDIAYYLKRWEKIGDLATKISEYTYSEGKEEVQ